MSSPIKVYQTPLFLKRIKKLKANQKADLDMAVKRIIDDPEAGVQKKGDLSDVWVLKFKMVRQEMLLAYQWDPEKRVLIALSVHENFYRDIKTYLKS